MDEIKAPDTPVAIAARDLAREASSDALYNHCQRTYLLGAAYGHRQSMDYDAEAFYVASLLHDLGLTERFDGPGEFEREGAEAAARFLAERGYPGDRTELVRDAITVHMQAGSGEDARPEVALLQVGAGIDVLGLWLEDVPPDLVERAVEAWPRHGLKAELVRLFGEQARRKPDSWVGLLVANLDWLERIEAAPFSE
jgi:HD domain-containing protein